jgi:hypothetical protein
VPKSENNPSLSRLALQYGTITKDQYKQVTALLPGRGIPVQKEASLLLKQGLATRHQIGLLRMIREYQDIRRKSEAFGKLAVEKGFASSRDIRKALDKQKEAFRNSRLKKLIGDILVDARVISSDQKLLVLREQNLLEQKTSPPLSEDEKTGFREERDDVGLSHYEKEFLRVKALDEDFSAALMEKGLAGDEEIRRAKRLQDEAFEQENTIKLLGDIMVDLKMITPDQQRIIFQEQGRLTDTPKTPEIRVEICKDKMAAWVHLEPKGPGATVSDVKTAAEKAGIVQGLYPDAILHCGLTLGLTAIPVARKDYSTELRNARGLVSHLDAGLSEKGEKRKGDLLAEQQNDGAIGACTTLLGESADRHSDLDFTLRCGSGARRSKDGSRILAAKTGQPMLSVERFLFVHPSIHVLEDVDQRYGQVEPYANLTVSGTITGANPITAGHVTATEIRGAVIDAIGSIHSKVGITDAVIRAQGDVHARYLHNCRIEIFGNLFVENEIFDSDIRCAGKIDSPSCRVVSSRIFAKQGVVLAGTGSDKTLPCEVTAGSEHHLFSQMTRILEEVQRVESVQNRLMAKKDEKRGLARRAFEKMVEVKVFHDRAKQTRQMLMRELKGKKKSHSSAKQAQLLKLIANHEHRMEKAIATLKELNRHKKKHDRAGRVLAEKLERLMPKIQTQIKDLEQTLFAYLEWARCQPGTPRIEIKGKAYQGSVFKGVYSQMNLESDREGIVLEERGGETGRWKMQVL